MVRLNGVDTFSAKNVSTADLLKGLVEGFNITFYQTEAVNELIGRGEANKVRKLYNTRANRLAQAAIRRTFAEHKLSL